MFTRSDLKNGMIVELTDGKQFIKIDDMFVGDDFAIDVDFYKDDLQHYNCKTLDIVKVYKLDGHLHTLNLEELMKYAKVIWEIGFKVGDIVKDTKDDKYVVAKINGKIIQCVATDGVHLMDRKELSVIKRSDNWDKMMEELG